MKTIHNGGHDSPDVVLGRLKTSYPEYFLIYGEYWSLLDRVASEHLRAFIARGQQYLVRIVHDTAIDEYNKADQTAKVATNYRHVGHLNGMLAQLIVAENFALFSRYSTPLIWCELAIVYASIPFTKEAKRCVENAKDSLARGDTSHNAILPGDTSGRWIPEMGMDFYKAQIDETTKMVGHLPRDPEFTPSKTLELLQVKDEALKQEFVHVVTLWRNRFTSPSHIAPRIIIE
jgi:hypothetical protein